MNTLFINASSNKEGNTVHLAKTLLENRPYTTLHLVDHKVGSYGQHLADDQFDTILQAMKNADTIIIGSPVYWHNMSGALRNVLDRFYGPVEMDELKNRKLIFVFQGAAPEKWMLDSGEYTMSRFAQLYGLEYLGMATNERQAQELAKKI